MGEGDQKAQNSREIFISEISSGNVFKKEKIKFGLGIGEVMVHYSKNKEAFFFKIFFFNVEHFFLSLY